MGVGLVPGRVRGGYYRESNYRQRRLLLIEGRRRENVPIRGCPWNLWSKSQRLRKETQNVSSHSPKQKERTTACEKTSNESMECNFWRAVSISSQRISS